MFIITSGVGYRARLSFISVKILKRSDVHRGTHRSTVNLTKSVIIWMLLKLEQSLLWVRRSVIWLYMYKHTYNMIILYMVKYIIYDMNVYICINRTLKQRTEKRLYFWRKEDTWGGWKREGGGSEWERTMMYTYEGAVMKSIISYVN